MISDRRSGPRADFGSTLALTLTLACACFALVTSAAMLAVDPTPIHHRGELGEHRQDAETVLYLAAFFIILPLALVVAPRLADAVRAGPNSAALSSLVGILAGALAAAVLLARVFDLLDLGSGELGVVGGVGIWSAGALAVLRRATRPRRWPRLLALSRLAPHAWMGTGVLVLGVLLGLTSLGSISLPALMLASAAAVAVLLAYPRARMPRLPKRWGVAADIAVAVLLLLAVPDLVIFRPEEAPGDFGTAFETAIIQFHQNFLLGPANEVLAGGAVLVDTASQYGVGPIYLLAGWLELIPAGYGAFGLLDGLLTALLYASAYCLLRLAGASRPLAAAALAVAVVVLVFNLPYSVGALPEQGPLRFGLPMIVILATVVGARWPRRESEAWTTAILVVGLSSVWAFESLVYTLSTFAALAAVGVWLTRDEGRLRWLVRQGALVAAACLAAHLLFAGATLLAAGQLPEWDQYLAFLRGFLFGKLGEVTYDFSPWSPALAVGIGYAASAAAIVLLGARRPELVRRQWPAMIAVSGTTAYGIVLFSYFVDRSGDGILPYVALPAVLTGALWLSLLVRPATDVSRNVRRAALAFGLSLAVLPLAVAWSSVSDRFPRSALAHAFPRGNSLRDALDRLRHPPPLNPRAPDGERLLDTFMPGQRRVLILTVPDLGVEILVRSGRANELPFGDPIEDSFVASEHLARLQESIAGLEPGSRMLLDQTAVDALAEIRSSRSSSRLEELTTLGSLASLQRRALEEIDERFRLRSIHRDGLGFTVVELIPRR